MLEVTSFEVVQSNVIGLVEFILIKTEPISSTFFSSFVYSQ